MKVDRPKFGIGVIEVPKSVYSGSAQPRIVGVESGQMNRRIKVQTDTWIYWIVFEPGLEAIPFSQEEIELW